MLSRRTFVGRLAVGAAVAGAVSTIGTRAQARTTAAPLDGAPPISNDSAAPDVSAPTASAAPAVAPWELLTPLTAGAALGHGWQLAGLSAVEAGACVLTVQHASGRTQRVHVCRHAGAPAGMVHTDTLDLLVMNDGAGAQPTDEGLAQAVATLGHVLARNEHAAPHELEAHAARVARYAATAQLR